MTRGIFIAGNESTLFKAICTEAAGKVESFASAVIPGRLAAHAGGLKQKSETVRGQLQLPWNPASPISARTLVLAAENRLGRISDAILVCSPPAFFKTADVLEPEEIEILVDDHIKGWFFLTRELILNFRRYGSGTLSFVAGESSSAGKNMQTDLLGPPAAACFLNFAGGVLSSSANEPFRVMGFSYSETNEKDEFASWLFKMVDEGSKKNTCRWNRYSKISFLR